METHSGCERHRYGVAPTLSFQLEQESDKKGEAGNKTEKIESKDETQERSQCQELFYLPDYRSRRIIVGRSAPGV